jgi:hypothetical protein
MLSRRTKKACPPWLFLSKVYNKSNGDEALTLNEDLQDTVSLLVDETGDTLDTTTACKTADSELGNALDAIRLVGETRDTLDTTTARKTADSELRDTLDVVTKDLAMTLGTTPVNAICD